jgi:hypothetical protein
MNPTETPLTNPVRPQDLETRLHCAVRDWRSGIFILALAILLQCAGHLNGDTAWFMTFAENYLAGSTPYVDVSDPNPPFAFLAYAPAIGVARLFGIKPGFAVALMTFVGSGAALFVCGRILRQAEYLDSNEVVPLGLAALYVLLFVPTFCFAEREHLALLRPGGGEICGFCGHPNYSSRQACAWPIPAPSLFSFQRI